MSHLRQTLAVATTSWEDAESVRQASQREAAAIKHALQQITARPDAPKPIEVTDEEERRLRMQLEALQAERERTAQVEQLQAEAVRMSRVAAAAEVEAKMRHLHLEKVEAQQQAVVARLQTQEVIQASQRSPTSVPVPRSPVSTPPAPPTREFGMSATEFHVSSASELGAPAAALLAGMPQAGPEASPKTLTDLIEVHQQLQKCQTSLRSQSRLAAMLQDKLRLTEEKLKDALAAETRARADHTRQASKRKEDQDLHGKALKKAERRADQCQQRLMAVEATNDTLRDEISGLRKAILSAEKRAVIAEDGCGPVSRGELRKVQDQLAEEKRKLREKDREIERLMAAQEKVHNAQLREAAAKHDARKVTLKNANRLKDAAMDKLHAERVRADAAEYEAVLSHKEAQRLAAERAVKAIAPKGPIVAGIIKSPSRAFVDANKPQPAASPIDFEDLADHRPNRSLSPTPRAHTPPPPAPTILEDELGRATRRAVESIPKNGDRPQYSTGTDTKVLNIGGNGGLFDRTSAGGASPHGTGSTAKAATALKEQLASSLARMGDLFRTWDRKGTGTIDRVEFRLAVKALGLDASEPVCDSVFREFDTDGSGSVDYKEYVFKMLRDAIRRMSGRLMDVFQRMDSNRDGTISRAEFRKGLQEFGFDASPSDLDAVFDDIDSNGGCVPRAPNSEWKRPRPHNSAKSSRMLACAACQGAHRIRGDASKAGARLGFLGGSQGRSAEGRLAAQVELRARGQPARGKRAACDPLAMDVGRRVHGLVAGTS